MNTPLLKLSFVLLVLTTHPCYAQPETRTQMLTRTETKVLLDTLSRALNREYVFPQQATKMAAYLKNQLKNGAYTKIKDRTELSRQLNTDLQQAYPDRHMEIVYNPGIAHDVETYVPDTASNRRMYERNFSDAKAKNFAFKKVEILPSNVGYIRWDGFYEFVDESKPVVDAALRFVSGAGALIIDMRNNGGGSPDMVLRMQSYFFRQKTAMNYIISHDHDTTKRFTDPTSTEIKLDMPVYILTSRRTFSAAEDFTYGLKYAKRAVVVGDTTGGGAHPTRPFSIGQGFVAFIPTQRSFNTVTQTDWDGIGVLPDITAPTDEALTKALELVYSEQLGSSTNERDTKTIRWNLTANENRNLLTRQMRTNYIIVPQEEMTKYGGEYYTSEPNPIPSIFIIQKGNHLARHLDHGAEDIRLVPVSPSKFIYDDESGRSVEFETNRDGTLDMILTTQDGATRRRKK